jgi:hypothetical protein
VCGSGDTEPVRCGVDTGLEEVLIIGQTWWTVALTALSLCSGLACLAMAVLRIGDHTAQVAHGVMGLAMAGMLSPWGDPVPTWAGAVAFTVIGAWFAAGALGSRPRPDAPHLAISSAAMVVMYLMSRQVATDGGTAGGHAGHAVGGGAGGVPGLLFGALGVLFAAYFVWHVWIVVDRTRAAGRRQASPVTVRTRPQLVPHIVMSTLMAAMFLGAA